MTDDREARLRAALIDTTAARQPIKQSDLYNHASRVANCMTPFAFAMMQDLIGEGFLTIADDGLVLLGKEAPQ